MSNALGFNAFNQKAPRPADEGRARSPFDGIQSVVNREDDSPPGEIQS